MLGSEGPVVQARSTWYSKRHVVRSTGLVADLTVPVVRAAVARQGVYAPALNRLRRLGGACRTSEIELGAGDPDAMHDHRKLTRHGDGGALHTPAFGDGDTPSPQARPLAGTSHQRRCGLVEKVPQRSIAALADLPRSVYLARLIHARCEAGMRAERFRGTEAVWVVDRRDVCEGGHRSDARNGHQAATDIGAPGRRGQGPVLRLPLSAHCFSHP